MVSLIGSKFLPSADLPPRLQNPRLTGRAKTPSRIRPLYACTFCLQKRIESPESRSFLVLFATRRNVEVVVPDEKLPNIVKFYGIQRGQRIRPAAYHCDIANLHRPHRPGGTMPPQRRVAPCE